jgi:hypothetical protein
VSSLGEGFRALARTEMPEESAFLHDPFEARRAA